LLESMSYLINDRRKRSRRTVVLGASANPSRYSYSAVNRLRQNGYDAIPVGLRSGEINGTEILVGRPPLSNIDTVSLYIGAGRQPALYDYIFDLNPRRLIFNPGTENIELEQLAKKRGIETTNACSLVLLSTGQY